MNHGNGAPTDSQQVPEARELLDGVPEAREEIPPLATFEVGGERFELRPPDRVAESMSVEVFGAEAPNGEPCDTLRVEPIDLLSDATDRDEVAEGERLADNGEHRVGSDAPHLPVLPRPEHPNHPVAAGIVAQEHERRCSAAFRAFQVERSLLSSARLVSAYSTPLTRRLCSMPLPPAPASRLPCRLASDVKSSPAFTR